MWVVWAMRAVGPVGIAGAMRDQRVNDREREACGPNPRGRAVETAASRQPPSNHLAGEADRDLIANAPCVGPVSRKAPTTLTPVAAYDSSDFVIRHMSGRATTRTDLFNVAAVKEPGQSLLAALTALTPSSPSSPG